MTRPPLADADPQSSSGPEVGWLFLDLNAYFASIEQQERPELRGRPVGVVPLITPNTVCIAASYEAKPFGVKTGVKVRDAQRLCPQIELVVARPQLYVAYHQRILAAVETVVPVTRVYSIDEAACRLTGRERLLANARALAWAVKQALREAGETLRCSIGLAPNSYLAKVASDMQKPDGLTTLIAADLPGSLAHLALTDLPGIGTRTEARLRAHGIHTMPQLLALTRARMGEVWGSVQGERLWDRLRGADADDPEPPTKTLGRQHVLPPDLRTRNGAMAVAQKLLQRAAEDLRRRDLWAGALAVAVHFLSSRPSSQNGEGGFWRTPPDWRSEARFELARDSFTLQSHLAKLWQDCPDRSPILVSVRLSRLVADADRPRSLFDPASGDRPANADALTVAMDAVNRKFGAQTLLPASQQSARSAAPPRIAFRHVPKSGQDW